MFLTCYFVVVRVRQQPLLSSEPDSSTGPDHNHWRSFIHLQRSSWLAIRRLLRWSHHYVSV